MKRNLYLVDKEKIDEKMLELGLSNTMLAELIGQKAPSRAIEVNIGAIRKGKILSCELSFLNKIEEVLKLPKDSTALSHVQKREVEQAKRAKIYQQSSLQKKLKELLSVQKGEIVSLERKVVEEKLVLL